MKRYAVIIVCLFFSTIMQAQNPNIILIFCDDLIDLDSPYAQSLNIHTPHIDALKSSGVKFSHAVCNAPICAPSRASMLTGKYPHTTGYYGYNMGPNAWNLNPVIQQSPPVFQHLKNNGYSVYGSGKIFHSSNASLNQENFDQYAFQPSGPFAWDGISYNSSGKKVMQPHPDNHEFLSSHFDGVYPLSNIPQFPDTSGWFQHNEPFYYENDTIRDLLADESTVDFANEVLSMSHTNPFFLTLGFRKPHTPYFLPQAYFDMYPLNNIEVPISTDTEMEGIGLANFHNRNYVKSNNQDYEKLVVMSEDSLDNQWWIKKHIQGYLASVTFLDDMVGEVLQMLENSTYAENTYIIFTSDHGYTFGQKQTFNKNNLWGPALDIPMYLTGPGIAQNASVKMPVSLIDVYPTIIDFAGLPAPSSGLDGYSMKNLAENPTSGNWNGQDYAISAVSNDELIPIGISAKKEHQHFAITTDSHRYIRLSSGEEELYDLTLDPTELSNVAFVQNKLSDKLNLKNQLDVIIPLDSSSQQKGSLLYGNFEQNLNGWKLSKKSDSTYAKIVNSPNTITGDKHFRIETIPYVFEDYKFNISNSNLELRQGHNYSLTFDARSSHFASKVKFILERKNGYDSYGKVGGVGIPLDTIWQNYSLNFTYPGYSSRTDFNLVIKFMKKNRIYELDNIKICDLTTDNCEDDCLVSGFDEAPADSYTYLTQSGFEFHWTAPLGITACEIQGNLASAPVSDNESQMTYGSLTNPPESLGPINFDGFFPLTQPIITGEVYRWRVRCGCSESTMSPFSDFNYFSVPVQLDDLNHLKNSAIESMDIYPNPSSNGVFYSNFTLPPLIRVFDSKGSMVFEGSSSKNILDLSHLQPGIYALKLFDTTSIVSSKLVIQ